MSKILTQDDLESELNHLRCLIEQATNMLQEIPHNTSEQEIISALIWVSRDIAQDCCQAIAAMPARSMEARK